VKGKLPLTADNGKVFGVVGGDRGAFKIVQDRPVYDAGRYGGCKGFQEEWNGMKVEEAAATIEALFREVTKQE